MIFIKQLLLCCPRGSLYSLTTEDNETENELKLSDPGLELFVVVFGHDALDKKQLLLVLVGDKLF